MIKRFTFLGIGLTLILGLALLPKGLLRAQDDQTAKITSPQAGQTVVGVVTISGIASNANFRRYKLEYAALEGPVRGQWFPITEIQQQVPNGALGQWNTANVPDGRYQLRLRVILSDNTIIQALVGDVTVSNTQPTPLPTILASPTILPTAAPPTAGPSPTLLIQQPPTLTPVPTTAPLAGTSPTPVALVNAPDSSAPRQSVLLLSALQNAFCAGAAIATVGFLLLGAYRLTIARMRPRVRRMVSELRSDRD